MSKRRGTDKVERCRTMVRNSNGYGPGWRCTNPAKRDGWCGVHDPEAKKARAEKRGPPAWKVDSVNRANWPIRAHNKAIEEAALLVESMDGTYPKKVAAEVRKLVKPLVKIENA